MATPKTRAKEKASKAIARDRRVVVIWEDRHYPVTANVVRLIDEMPLRPGEHRFDRISLSEATGVPPSIILSDDGNDLRAWRQRQAK